MRKISFTPSSAESWGISPCPEPQLSICFFICRQVHSSDSSCHGDSWADNRWCARSNREITGSAHSHVGWNLRSFAQSEWKALKKKVLLSLISSWSVCVSDVYAEVHWFRLCKSFTLKEFSWDIRNSSLISKMQSLGLWDSLLLGCIGRRSQPMDLEPEVGSLACN